MFTANAGLVLSWLRVVLAWSKRDIQIEQFPSADLSGADFEAGSGDFANGPEADLLAAIY